MRFELALALMLCGCAVDLEDQPPAPKPGPEAPLASGCAPFGGGASGGIQSIALLDGRVLWTVESFEGVVAVGFFTTDATLSDCLASAGEPQPLFDSERLLIPLDGAVVDGVTELFFQELDTDLSVAGVGLATDLVAGDTLLWTGDRPRYGTAAAAEDGLLFAWGCQPARYLSADCFLARAPAGDLGAYEYARGGGHWTTNVEEAWPLVEASNEIDIAPIGGGRWLMAYAPPLSREIVFRSGLSGAGPWSQPIVAARCAVPEDNEAFCHHVALHPSLATTPGRVVVSYAVGTFSTEQVPSGLAAQLVEVEIPPVLP
jgi:hypothetical protein